MTELNHGFKEAHREFKKISSEINDSLNPDIKTILEMLKTGLEAIDNIMDFLDDDTKLVIDLGVAGGLVVLIILQTFILLKFIRDIQVPGNQQNSCAGSSSGISEQELRTAVAAAVSEAVEASFRNTMGRAAITASERPENNTRLSCGAQFTGNVLALQAGTRQAYN